MFSLLRQLVGGMALLIDPPTQTAPRLAQAEANTEAEEALVDRGAKPRERLEPTIW